MAASALYDSTVVWQAMAAHNSGGIVIVQVLRLVERGSLPFRGVHIPGALVTKVRALWLEHSKRASL